MEWFYGSLGSVINEKIKISLQAPSQCLNPLNIYYIIEWMKPHYILWIGEKAGINWV